MPWGNCAHCDRCFLLNREGEQPTHCRHCGGPLLPMTRSDVLAHLRRPRQRPDTKKPHPPGV